jgi:hypothetical protein
MVASVEVRATNLGRKDGQQRDEANEMITPVAVTESIAAP